MRKGLILTVILMSLSELVYSQNASWNVTNVATWIEAVNGIRSGGNNKDHVITVTGNISIPSSTENTFGYITGLTVTITGSGTLSSSNNGALLQIGAEQTVIVKDLTLKGRADNNSSVVCVAKGGTFRMEGNAKVSSNTVFAAFVGEIGGGGVYVKGNFIMQDMALISGNAINLDLGNMFRNIAGGGGVNVDNDGTFIMRGNAKVSGNTVLNVFGNEVGGGGVYVRSGTFTMQDNAVVSDNTALIIRYTNREGDARGGGVYVRSGTFTMQDNASVWGNTATFSGGGVYNSGAFNMQSGAISSNTTSAKEHSYGGGVYNDGTFTMKGGSISTNTASAYSGTIYAAFAYGGGVYNYGTFTMQDGKISGNTAVVRSEPSLNHAIGGGVYADGYNNRGVFTMQGGELLQN